MQISTAEVGKTGVTEQQKSKTSNKSARCIALAQLGLTETKKKNLGWYLSSKNRKQNQS